MMMMTTTTGSPTLLAAIVCFLLCLSSVAAVPVRTSSTAAKKPKFSGPILGPPPPHFIAYSDESQYGIPGSKDLEGFNTLILSFLLADGPADQAAAWAQMSDSDRAALKADYHAHNITLLVSAFGSTESPTMDGKDPTELAQDMAAWVKKYDLDGIDVDYEDFKAVSKGTAGDWLITFTKELRKNLPAGDFALTHAPVAPWFARDQLYSQVNETVGHLIDWYNVQFYSQGTEYTSCESLVRTSGGAFPGTSLLEIVAAGIPQEKVVMGKPANAAAVGVPVGGDGGGGGTQVADGNGGGTQVASEGETEVAVGGGTQVASGGGTEFASSGGGTEVASGRGTQVAKIGVGLREEKLDPHINGFLETNTLAQCVLEAKNEGWNAGVMVWEFPDAGEEWIQTVRSLAWPYKKAKKAND